MNKYKLKKEYPNSPELGYVIEEKLHYGTWGYFLNCFPLYPEKYPEFWEKVVEQDYEIIAFRQLTGISVHYITKGDVCYKNMDVLLNAVKNGNQQIYSVKRLSDGEIFTIGDLVTAYSGASDKILSFNTIYNDCYKKEIAYATFKNLATGGLDISCLKKAKQPLFKTEDGIDIYEGDNWVRVRLSDFTILGIYGDAIGAIKTFSTKEAAEEYVLLNKPCLSLKDVFDEGSIFCLDEWEKRLKDLVKSRLK
jgi:hypothetical protein